VNNAGVYPRTGVLINLEPAEYDRIMNVNVRAPFLVVQAMSRLMVAQGVAGAIVNIGSGAARQMPTGSVTYCMSKTALERLSKGQALELAPHKIRVNVVEPGFAPGSDFSYLPPDYVDRMTARIPLGRNSEPGDAAGMVMYLCSQSASYITGAVVSCDGGNSIGTFQPATNS
jgi:3-oxoacyl-[acyl-carrier protein] reductase